jgi:hypothetical protein
MCIIIQSILQLNELTSTITTKLRIDANKLA